MNRLFQSVRTLALTSFLVVISCSSKSLVPEDPGKKDNSLPSSVTAKIIETGCSKGKAYEFEKELTTKIGGRPVGSRALLDAEAWAAAKFKKMGLEVTVQEVGRMPVEFVRGKASGVAHLGNQDIDLHFVTPVYTAGTNGTVSGTILTEPLNHYQFDRIKDKLDGAWILVNGDSDGTIVYKERMRAQYERALAYNDSLATAYNEGGRVGAAPQFRTLPALMYEELVAAGVKGFIQPGDAPLKCLMDRAHCFTLTAETLPTVCDVKLERAQYRQIRQFMSAGNAASCTFNIDNTFKVEPIPYSNIIARMEGTVHPDEYVIIGGHLDAFDSAVGAVDCGLGTSTVLEVARLLTSCGARPERTILFCLWTGEEYGLLGSKYFVENNTVDFKKVSNYLNRDGGSSTIVAVGVLPNNYDDMLTVCKPLLEDGKVTGTLPDGFQFRLNRKAATVGLEDGLWPGVNANDSMNSDHQYFARSGVPCYSLGEGDPLKYGTKVDEWWHTDTDDLTKVHPDYLQHNAVVSAVVLYGLANLPNLLAR